MKMEILEVLPKLPGNGWCGGGNTGFDVGLFLMASPWFQFLVLLSVNTEAALALHSFIHSHADLLALLYFFF